MNRIAKNKVLLLVTAAFLVGVLGTMALLSRFRPSGNGASETARSMDGKAAGTPSPDADGDAATKPDADSGSGGAQTDKDVVTLRPSAARNAGIQVITARLAPSRDALTVPGTVETLSGGVAKITPPAAGKVIRILVGLGDPVRAGQPLAILDSADVAQAQTAIRQAQSEQSLAVARVQTAQAQVEAARERESLSLSALRRQRQLAQAGAFSQSPFQAAQSERSQAQAELLQAQTELLHLTSILKRDQELYADGLVPRSQVEQAQTDQRQSQIRVDQGQARVNIAQQALTREQKVFGQDLLSRQAIQTAQSDVQAAQGETRRLEAELSATDTSLLGARGAVAAARANLRALTGGAQPTANDGQITLFAPISGVVAERSVTLGEAVERSTPLLVLDNLRSVLVQADVAEQDIGRVRVGQAVVVTVTAYPGRVFTGHIESLASGLDEKTRTLAVRCLVENHAGLLRPAMFAQVALATGTEPAAILVPASALVDSGGAQVVFVAEAGGYRPHAVTVGNTVGKQVQILRGVAPGERVVTTGAFVLQSEAQKGALKDTD